MSRVAVAAEQEATEVCEESTKDFQVVDALTNLGISATDVKKLKDAGVHTIQAVVMCTKKQLISIKGLSEAKAEKIRECALKLCSTGFITGVEMANRRKEVIKISTGSQQLDDLLGGGVESGSITEAYGEFRTGKTQLAHTLCVTSMLPVDQGGANGKCAYIDTENTFRPERIQAIAERFELESEDVLNNVIVGRAFTTDHQMELLYEVAGAMSQDQFGLLIIDSVISLFRVDFNGRGELADRQQKLNKFMSMLIKIAEQYNVAVFITNQVMSNPDAMSFATGPRPAGGHVLSHASTTRLSLRKGREDQRIVKLVDSPMLAESEVTIQITNEGIRDPTD